MLADYAYVARRDCLNSSAFSLNLTKLYPIMLKQEIPIMPSKLIYTNKCHQYYIFPLLAIAVFSVKKHATKFIVNKDHCHHCSPFNTDDICMSKQAPGTSTRPEPALALVSPPTPAI